MQSEPLRYEHATEPFKVSSGLVRTENEHTNERAVGTPFEHALLIKAFEAHVDTLKARLSSTEAQLTERTAQHAAEQAARIKALEDYAESLKAQLAAAEDRAERQASLTDPNAKEVARQASLIQALEGQVAALKAQAAEFAERNPEHGKRASLTELEGQVSTLKAQLSAAEARAERQAEEFAELLAEKEAAIVAERGKAVTERAKSERAMLGVPKERDEVLERAPNNSWWRRGSAPRQGAIPEGRELRQWQLPSAAFDRALHQDGVHSGDKKR